jgi:hypothetical protein
MSGTKAGSIKAKATIIEKYGENHWKTAGYLGGTAEYTGKKGFAANIALARSAGKKGGHISRRGKATA